MAKKSQTKLRRLEARAAARGEVYKPPISNDTESKEKKIVDKKSAKVKSTTGAEDDTTSKKHREESIKVKAAQQLIKDLTTLESKQDLNAKDRRAAKRKAEAVAAEASGCSASDLLHWYKVEHSASSTPPQQSSALQEDYRNGYQRVGRTDNKSKKRSPYVLFAGQLDYTTTKDELFAHIHKELIDTHTVTPENVQIRMLTDPTTHKFRGMAFIEVDTPEMLYGCLKLHHTMLKQRRINIERSAGGKRDSEARKEKLKRLRTEQSQHMEQTVQSIYQEYVDRGEIRHGELDEGVLKVCARHSATIVQAAFERYMESNGKDMENPSAYLTFLLGKLATEGIYTHNNDKDEKASMPKNKKFKKMQ
jgi:RNA recognition motif-containing protein